MATVATIGITGISLAPAYAGASGGVGGKAGNVTLNKTAGAVKVLPHDQLPANAVKVTGGQALPKPGALGPAFQPRTSTASPRIVGGTPVNAADYPYVVGIMVDFLAYDEDGTIGEWIATCTGTIISPTKVLTAGHCVTDFPDGTTEVIAGRSVLGNFGSGSGGYVAKVQSTWTDPTYNLAAQYNGTAVAPIDDVSVLTLQQPLPQVYTPIALTAQGDQTPYAENTTATIVGYGITNSAPGAPDDSGTLRMATVPMQSDATCAVENGYDPSRMTCAGPTQGGTDSCFGDSGGPLIVGGVETGITDWGDEQCAQPGRYGVYERLSYYSNAVKADLTRSPVINLDFTGDGTADLLARDGSGDIAEFTGGGFVNDGYNGFSPIVLGPGSGWGGFTKLFRVNNWNQDGLEVVMAEDSTGHLFEYFGDGFGGFTGDRAAIGSAWNQFSDIMVVNNWVGDGLPGIMGRKPNGDLFLYESDGHGGWANGGIGQKIGNGWNAFDTVITPGIWKGDGHQALIGRRPSGELDLYESDGHGGWINSTGTKIGTGWNTFKQFLTVGDFSGDDQIDIIGVTPAGVLKLYETDGTGNWLTPNGLQIGSGWNVFNTIF